MWTWLLVLVSVPGAILFRSAFRALGGGGAAADRLAAAEIGLGSQRPSLSEETVI